MVGSIKKALGIGKSNFYLELDESQEKEAAAQQPDAKAVEAPAAAVTEAAASTAEAVTEAAASTAEAVAEAASTAAAVAPEAEAQPKAPKSKSKASKKKSAKKQAPVEAKAPAPQSADPAAIAASAVNGSNAPSSVADDKTFAPNYLMPVPTKSRRRPGPSLKMFQDMARQVTPRK